ncbi:MAG: PD-(D/E)XK nuclease family protein, partial [Anaeromyxobacteraceae bacterium]
LAELGALDAAAALRAAAEAVPAAVRNEELLALDLLVLDGFHELSPAAFDLVAALAHRARRTHARVPYFAERADLCAPSEPLLRRLEALHELAARREVNVVLPGIEPERDRSAAVARLLREVGAGVPGAAAGAPPGAAAPASDGRVVGACGAGEGGEAEVVARLVARLLDDGVGPDDVVVLAASPARAAGALQRAFAARGLPFAAGRGTPLDEAPPVRALLGALDAAATPTRAALEALAASAWLGVRAPPRLGYWLDRAGALDVRGDPEASLRRRALALSTAAASRERRGLVASAEALEEVRVLVRSLAAPATAREHAARLRGLVARTGARRRAGRASLPAAQAALAAIGRLDDAAEDVVRALALVGRAGEALRAAEWASLLRTAVGARTVPREGPAAAAVELWGVADAPGVSARAAVVMGCARGAFPPAPAAEPLLRDAEREAVNRAAGRLGVATGAQRRATALYLGFSALAAARERLALTWPAPGPDGSGGPPSPFAVDALAAAGVAAPLLPAPEPALAASRTRAEALRGAARSGRRGDGAEALRVLSGAAQELAASAASALARGALEAERRLAIGERRPSRGAGGLGDVLPLLAHALPDEWTPSQLETHARCPYRLFAGMVLALPERDGADLDIDPRDEGRIGHAVLERFLRERRDAGALPLRGTEEESEALRAAAAAIFERFAADGRVGDAAVWAARRAAVVARLERVVRADADAADGLSPALLEYGFGGDTGVPPLVFGEGADAVRMRGRLDRVDAGPDRLLLIDYKDSRAEAEHRKKLAPDALGETNFQVPTYLMAAARALPGRSEVAATYLLLRSAERLAPFRASGGDPLFAQDAAARAAARAAGVRPVADAVVEAVRSVRAGALPIASRDCGGCPFGAVCRAQALAEEAA